jgi:hypothetical protein
VTRRIYIPVCIFLLAVSPATAQVDVGNFNLNGNATVSAGYTGDFGNQTGSDHGVTFGGVGTLAGYYYNPGFLTFNLQPFLNQSRENSNYQSISDSSGVNASTGIFGGSNFPGTVSYAKTFNAQGNYNVPGVTDFTSHGDSQNLNIGWSENVPDLPHLMVSFVDGTDHYSLYGASGDLASSYRTFSAQTNYRVDGFTLTGSFRDSAVQSDIPSILGSSAETTDSDTISYSAGIGHSLPFHGSISLGASRSEVSADFSDGTYNATVDTLNGGMSFNPLSALSVGVNFQYNDNLAGSLDQSIVAAGGNVGSTPQQASHSMDLLGYANYKVLNWHLTFSASEEHRDQNFMGESYQSDTTNGSVTYSNNLLGGFLNATAGVTRSLISSNNQTQLGAFGSINYLRELGRWSVSGMVNYAQDTQTVLIAYTSSGYGYSGSLARKLGKRSHWSATTSGSKSILSNEPGAGTFSQSYSTALSLKWISVSGAYSRSDGNSILTASGLTPVTVPLPVIAPSSVILYGGHSYSGAVGLSPFRGLTMSVSYAQALADTQANSVSSNNRTSQLNTYLQYRFRKIYFTAGFSKLTQSFSSNASLPAMVGSYYLGLSRWFNFL